MKKKIDLKWIIWGLAAVFYFYEFVLRVSPSVMVFELMKSFNITAGAVGVLAAFYLYAYAPLQLPVGMLLDRFGLKKVLSIASIGCGLGALFFSVASNLPLASFGRFLIGAGSSFAFIAMVYVSTHFFERKKRGFLIGVANSLAMLGASAGSGPLASIIQKFGWRPTIFSFGIFGIFLGFSIYFVLKSDVKEEKTEELIAKKKHHVFENLKKVSKQRSSWINGFIALFFYITTTGFAGLWGISFIETSYNVTKQIAGYSISMVFAGWLFGGPLMGIISDFAKKRKNIIRIGILGTLISLVFVVYTTFIPIYFVYFLLFLVGFFSSAELLSFSLAIELNSFETKATAAAFTNFLISCGDALVQPLIGFLLDLSWSGKIIDGVRSYSSKDYRIALSCLPVALILAFLLLFFIKEKEPS